MNDRTFLSCVKMHDNGNMTSDSKWRKCGRCVTIKLGFQVAARKRARGYQKKKEGYSFMGDGRTRRIYRSLAGALAMTLVIGTLGCGMPSENESSMKPDESVVTEMAATPEDGGESSSEESTEVSESTSAEESLESMSSDGGESTPAESIKTRKSVKEPGDPKEYVWDFDELVNAQWKEQEKKEHPKGSTFVGNYSKAMEDYFNDIVDNTNLDELSKEDGLYKILYVYRQ